MKKVFYLIINVLEIALIAGTFMVNYFTVKKLGMNRWVNAIIMKWESTYPISLIKTMVLLLMIMLTVMMIYLYVRKKKELKKLTFIQVIMMLIVSMFSVGYIMFNSITSMRSYYFIAMMLAVASLLQIIQTFVGIITNKVEK